MATDLVTLYDYRFSGNGWKVRRMLRLLEIPHRRVEVDIVAGETRTSAFRAKNPVGEIPVLELADGTCLAESNAILLYLADGTAWLPDDRVERAEAIRWMCFEQTHVDGVISRARFRRAFPDVIPTTEAQLDGWARHGRRALRVLDAHLESRDWLVGGRPTVADIAVFAYVHVADQGGVPLDGLSHVAAWCRRVEGLPRHLSLDAEPAPLWVPRDPRVLVLGNSGAGKTTLARRLADQLGLTWLDLDTVVFDPDQVGVMRDAGAIAADLDAFVACEPRWVAEGSYGDWIAHLAGPDRVLVWLNPGIDVCLAHHAARPWEPHKYADAAEQDQHRAFLEGWVKSYPERDDAFGEAWHRRTFEAFEGPKIEAVDAVSAVAFVERALLRRLGEPWADLTRSGRPG